MGIIRRLATQEGYDVIVDKQAVPYSRSDLDVTDRVITLFNQGGPVEADPKAAPASKSGGAPKPLAPPSITPPAAQK